MVLSFAYYFSGDRKYADKAMELLRIWFIDPETRVNPNINYGQAVPGLADGRPAGLIEWAQISTVITAMQIFERGGVLTPKMKDELIAWLEPPMLSKTASLLDLELLDEKADGDRSLSALDALR